VASDIKFQGEAVLVEGQLAVGTTTPQRPVHAESGEIHSGGPAGGLSFADRTTGGFVAAPGNGQRWVWFAEGGRAKLWSGADALSARRDPATGFLLDVNGMLVAKAVNAATVGATTVNATTVNATTTSSTNVSAGSITANQLTANAVSSPNYTGAKVTVTGTVAASSVTANAISSADYTGTKIAVTGLVTAGNVHTGTVSGDRLSVRTISGTPEDEPFGVLNVVCRAHGLSLIDPAAPTRTEQAPDQIISGEPVVGRASGDPAEGRTNGDGLVEGRADGDPVVGRASGDPVVAAPPPPPPPPPPPTFPVPPRIALFHAFGPDSDQLVLNRFGRYKDGVGVDGDLVVSGEMAEVSSITMKEDVHPLTRAEAATALRGLEAVTYRHRLDPDGARHVGFIAEDVPDLVAKPGRDRLRAMDIVAVLTTVVQEQQHALDDLAAEVDRLQRAASSDPRPAGDGTSP
jgi:hypothetical protein